MDTVDGVNASPSRIPNATGRVFHAPTGRFVQYLVLASRSADPRKRAIADARVMARVAGFKVIDVVAAVWQPDDSIVVELQIQ